MATHIIDCNIWLRGEEPANSTLHRESDGKECCLGQLGRAAGILPETLTKGASPGELYSELTDDGHDFSVQEEEYFAKFVGDDVVDNYGGVDDYDEGPSKSHTAC